MIKKECGACFHFDVRDNGRKPWGFVVVEGKEVKQGVCRTNKGLALGVLNEQTPCKQSPGCFRPKDQIQIYTSLANAV